MSPDELSMRPGGGAGGQGRNLAQTVRVSDRDALDRYYSSEPITSQIGLSDLVSVADSLKGAWALEQRGGKYQEMRTEWLAFGVPVRHGAGNARLALGRGGCGSKRIAEELQAICDASSRSWHGAALVSSTAAGGRVRGGDPLCQKVEGVQWMEPYVDRWLLIRNCRFSDQNARYGTFRPGCAVWGPLPRIQSLAG